MFSPFGNDFIILSSMTDFYYPAAGVNTIGNWNYENGYQIKTANNLELTIAGSKLVNPTLELAQGWNLMPVLNNCNNPAEELFSPIIDHLQIVKEVAGTGVYWPQFGVNTLGELVPGKAYFVLVDGDVEFFLCTPSNSPPAGGRTGQRTGTSSQTLTVPHVRDQTLSEFKVRATPITHTIAIPQKVLSEIENGNILTIYNQNGLCCGAIPVQNQNLAITAFGNDPTAPANDGMIEGESLQFRVINPESGKESTMEVAFDEQMPQGGTFVNHGLSAVKSLENAGVEEFAGRQLNISVYPNPSTGEFYIQSKTLSVPHMRDETLTEFKYEISDPHGSIIFSGHSQGNDFSIDLSTYPKGIYYLKITQGGLQTVKKLVVQ